MDRLVRAQAPMQGASLADDGIFGPQYGQEFDFTMVFNNIILTTIPAALIIAACPVYLISSVGSSPVTAKKWPLIRKLVVALGLTAFDIARSAVWSYPQSATPLLVKTTLAAKIMATASSGILAAVLYYDHRYACQSSIFLSLLLSITVVTEGSRTRSFFLRGSSGVHPEMTTIAGLTLGGVLLRVILVYLLELPRDLIEFADEKLVPNATTGFWSRSLLIWTNPIMVRGYKKQIKMADLATLGPDTKSQLLGDNIVDIWNAADKKDKHALTKTCLRVLLWPIVSAWVAYMAGVAIFFGSVFTIWATLNQLGVSNSHLNVIQGLIGANVLVQAVSAIAESRKKETINHLSIMIRGSLTSIMADKVTRLPSTAASKSAILSLMTADINAIIDSLGNLFEISVAIPTTGIGLYLLYTVIGYASFFAIIAAIFTLLVGRFVGIRVYPALNGWNQAIEHRVTESAKVLAHTKAIKIMGLEPIIVRFLDDLREQEIDACIEYRKVRVLTIASFPIDYWFAPFIILVGAVKVTVWKDGLDPVGVWIALSFLRAIAEPMYFLLQGWGIFGAVGACAGRIQDFLLQDERVDIRQLKELAATSGKAEWSEKEKVQDGMPETQQSSLTDEEAMHSPCIILENVSVAANEAEKFVLKDLCFSIPANKLTIIIGPVGSGKSVLGKTLIGEITPSGGSIHATSLEMAYCDQSAWLPDGSIQDAVTMYSELDQARYDEVIDVCALRRDIEELGGDQTHIGSNGSKLSGGQRQRLALARALYSSCPIIIADDVLSALDHRTAMQVFNAVFASDGMLKKEGRSAVLVAHEHAWLPSADQVVSLRCDGQPAAIHRGKEAIRLFSETEGVAISAAFLSHAKEEEEKPIETLSPPDQDLDYEREEEEKLSAYKPDLALYRYLFKSLSGKLVATSVGFIMLYAFTEQCPDLYIRLWSGYSPRKVDYVWGMLGFMFVSIGLAFVQAWFYQFNVMPRISRQTHATFTRSVFGATVSFLTSTGSGNLLNRFGQDMTLFTTELPAAFNNTIYTGSLYITLFAFVLAGTNYTLLLTPPLFIILWLLQRFYLRTSQQMRILELEAKAPLFAQLSEMGAGIEHTRSFGIQAQVLGRSYLRLDDSQRPYYYLLTVQRWLLLMLDTLTLIITAVLITVALLATQTSSQPALGLSLYNIVSFSILSKKVIEAWTALETSLGAAMRLRDFETNTPSERDSADMQDAPDAWPTKGCVEFQNVSATYGPEPGLPLALRGITTTIEGGTKVTIAGRTGSGKSTMMLSLLNLVDITGKILIDNIDITQIPRSQLRSRITSMPQDSIEFAGSVWNNLLPLGAERANGEAITEVAVQDLLEEIGIWDHIKTKGGLQKPIAEMLFSAGQKQLFNVVRAILHHSQFETKIVLMDEITSSVDHAAKERIQSMMEAAFRGSTWIIISHDPQATMNCDTVLRMDGGALVQKEAAGQDASEKKESTAKE